MTAQPRKALRTSDLESAKPEWVSVGVRLAHIRGDHAQSLMANLLGVHKNTYARWERGEREIGADGLRRLVDMGWNANWLLTGIGPERGDAPAGAGAESKPSQILSDEALTIALEFADRCVGNGWLPRPRYATLVRLLYEGVTQGLPVAEVLQLGDRVSRAMAQGEVTDDGKPQLGTPGGGRAG